MTEIRVSVTRGSSTSRRPDAHRAKAVRFRGPMRTESRDDIALNVLPIFRILFFLFFFFLFRLPFPIRDVRERR